MSKSKWAKIGPKWFHRGEPVAVLQASDPLAPLMLEIWAEVKEALSNSGEDIYASLAAEGRECANDMRAWRDEQKLLGTNSLPDNLREHVIQAIIQSYFQGQIEEAEKK